ncbi:hypothetical protein EsDP_00000341 [Epichloe bromicola]|uniref:Uncharacterized protein n=1 Tax=Epichloe bromicola TaxID=79588 RepID=A0ABQ0CEN0_9HYPO
MADHDAARLPGHPDRGGLLTPEARSRTSYETGGSSRSAESKRRAVSGAAGSSPLASTSRQGHQLTGPSPAQRDDVERDPLQQRGGGTRRKGKPKSSGGFLLQSSIPGNTRPAALGPARDASHANGKASQPPQTPQSSRSNNRQSPLRQTDVSGRTPHDETNDSPQSAASRSEDSGKGDGRSRGSEEPPPRALPRSSEEDAGDVDATQIVQMALNLSESRRIASRRHVPRASPPRLGPLPDGNSGSNLRQHLQQQRKFSHNADPKILEAASPRLSSSGRLDSPLQAGFESAHDAHYRYQFSSSTLARAQKAKDHLELMAQYRRLLDVLPPLKAGFGPNLTTSPPGSPIATKPFKFSQGDSLPLGREYNPLQYIRNRKVRARERKVIDGERQGFGDVQCVKPWVDRVIERATSFATNPDDEDDCIMPKYPGADEPGAQVSMDSLSRTATRVRRPRVDWFVEPCDMVADAYWLEQKNHKELIEDRHWRKIFPSAAASSRSMSRETAVGLDAIPPFSMQDDDPLDSHIPGISKVDTGLSHNSAKDRAKQTLHNIRAFPHRHNGQTMPPDFVRHKKDSTSDVSGSESDIRGGLKKPSVQETGFGENLDISNDLSEGQMLDMVAKDTRERDHLSDALSEPEPGQFASSDSLRTPERNLLSAPTSRFHSRKGSMVDTSDSDRKPAFEKSALGSPVRYVNGRQSLDIPDRSRKEFVGQDHSLPTSPELRPTRVSTEPVVSAHLSPSWGRSGSPHRTNPISKIKQIIRDKGNEPGVDQEDSRRGPAMDPSSPETFTLPEELQSSPSKAAGVEQLHPEQARTNRRTGSTLLRPDDAAGLRGIFKAGPRIDTAIRGGVSKLGDMLWKRDGTSELPPDIETTDESENEKARGRSRSSTNVSRRPSRRRADGQNQTKQFLDIMPQFHHAHDANYSSMFTASKEDVAPGSTSHDQQSSPFDRLRPPRIDARSAPSSATLENGQNRAGKSDVSESDSGQGSSVPDGVTDADKRLDSTVEVSRPEDDGRSFGSRHWSFVDKVTSAEETRLTRREIARMRALVLSTGIKAMEISRRAQEAHKPLCPDALSCTGAATASSGQQPSGRQYHGQVAYQKPYIVAGRSLSTAIQSSGRRWQASADQFTFRTSPRLQNRIGDVRSRIADDLSEQSRRASELADETNRDVALGQPLKVKVVVDMIEKMLRRRRRRLRWVRRALWLTVEWLLVGFMWYVWFMVMILRLCWGAGKGLVNSVRWLLWL